MKKPIKILLLGLLAFLLVLIRVYENDLFYDPFLYFFKLENSPDLLPIFNSIQLLGNIILRFSMNTVLSLAILWVVFKDKGIIFFSLLLYLILFAIIFLTFCYLLFYTDSNNFLALFYVRRFLIQPIFLLILLPAFYFQKNRKAY